MEAHQAEETDGAIGSKQGMVKKGTSQGGDKSQAGAAMEKGLKTGGQQDTEHAEGNNGSLICIENSSNDQQRQEKEDEGQTLSNNPYFALAKESFEGEIPDEEACMEKKNCAEAVGAREKERTQIAGISDKTAAIISAPLLRSSSKPSNRSNGGRKELEPANLNTKDYSGQGEKQ